MAFGELACGVRRGRGGSRLMPSLFYLETELIVPLLNCRTLREKCMVKAGFEDALNRSYLHVYMSITSVSVRSEAQETKS